VVGYGENEVDVWRRRVPVGGWLIYHGFRRSTLLGVQAELKPSSVCLWSVEVDAGSNLKGLTP
jgi:hypothetical protein